MISKEYISNFKNDYVFKKLKNGFLSGHFQELIFGEGAYKLATQYDNSINNTVPSLVLITAHILATEKVFSPFEFCEYFKKIEISKENVCLILEYLDRYLTYQNDHNELKIDYKFILEKCKFSLGNNYKSVCYERIMESINSKIADKN